MATDSRAGAGRSQPHGRPLAHRFCLALATVVVCALATVPASSARTTAGQAAGTAASVAGTPGAGFVATGSHTVAKGESIASIAARTGTTPEVLAAVNRLGSSVEVRVGQRLRVPELRRVPRTVASPMPDENPERAEGDVPEVSEADLDALLDAAPGTIGQVSLLKSPKTEVVAAARDNRARLRARGVPSAEAMRSLIVRIAARYDVDPDVALAIADHESGFDMRKVSDANAIGVMQITPPTAAWASAVVGRELDVLSPDGNVTAGVLVLHANGRSGRSETLVIGGYYQGLDSLRKNGIFPDTRAYVSDVRARMDR